MDCGFVRVKLCNENFYLKSKKKRKGKGRSSLVMLTDNA
jgi:hypothetical protein